MSIKYWEKLKLKQYDIHVSHTLPRCHPLFVIKVYIIMHNLIIEDEQNIDNVSDIEYKQIDETLYV
jgi:hypothetical protein